MKGDLNSFEHCIFNVENYFHFAIFGNVFIIAYQYVQRYQDHIDIKS